MAISKEKKKELVAWYTDLFSRSGAAILTDYRGLTVTDTTQLRRKVQEMSSDFHIVKNNLVKLALQEAGLPVPEEMLEGPTAIGFCYGDIPPAAKALLDFAKETKILKIKGGLLGDRVINADQISAIADLPPREILLGQVLSTVQSPSGQIVGTVTSAIHNILSILRARIEQLEKQAAQA